MGFSNTTRARAWMVTIQVANMIKSGLSKEEYMDPEFLAEYMTKTWDGSGKNRTSGIAVCKSRDGLYHAHMACYGNTTTLKNVAKILFESHVEPQLSGKTQLYAYLKKDPPFDEKGEDVLHVAGLENIQDRKGERSDLEQIEEMIETGYTPNEIFETSFAYRQYEKMIKSAFIDKRIQNTPIIKKMNCEWHVGASGTGKSYYYYQLCEELGEENVYMCTDFQNGGLDMYIECGAPKTLFMDEFKGNMPFGQLLIMLDKYSRSQVHSRYVNTLCLWENVIITSVFPPEEAYRMMVEGDNRAMDSIKQLMRRLNKIVYHYISIEGEYKTYEQLATEYENYEKLKKVAHKDNVFIPVQEEIKF